jgi:hypothetical protein
MHCLLTRSSMTLSVASSKDLPATNPSPANRHAITKSNMRPGIPVCIWCGSVWCRTQKHWLLNIQQIDPKNSVCTNWLSFSHLLWIKNRRMMPRVNMKQHPAVANIVSWTANDKTSKTVWEHHHNVIRLLETFPLYRMKRWMSAWECSDLMERVIDSGWCSLHSRMRTYASQCDTRTGICFVAESSHRNIQ